MRLIGFALFCSLYLALCSSDDVFVCKQRKDENGKLYWPLPCEHPNNEEVTDEFDEFMDEMNKYLFGDNLMNPQPQENFDNSQTLYSKFMDCTKDAQYLSNTEDGFKDKMKKLRIKMTEHVRTKKFGEEVKPCP